MRFFASAPTQTQTESTHSMMPTNLRFRSLCLLLAFFLLPTFGQTQTTAPFPENPELYVRELGVFMTASKRPDLEEAYDLFKKNLKSGRVSPDQLTAIIRFSNTMATQKLAPFPYFLHYFNAVNAAVSQAMPFTYWHSFLEEAVRKVPKGRTKPILQLLEFSVGFLREQALETGEGGAVTWKIRGGQFSFEHAGDQPVVRCTQTDIVGVRKQDSVVIRQTSGVFHPYEDLWRGQGGVVNWQQSEIDSSVYAELNTYKIETQKPLLRCDSAQLHYPRYFGNNTALGWLELNVTTGSNKANFPYPKFESYDKSLNINKLGEGMEYTGGFRLEGSSLYGFGTAEQKAQLSIFNNKRQKIFSGKGALFIIRREANVIGSEVSANLYTDADSIAHPSVDFRFDIPSQVITLTRGEKGSDRNPFYASYYHINLNTEKITWYVRQDSLEIGSRAGNTRGIEQQVSFESNNYFDRGQYDRMQHLASHNPISTLYILSKQVGSTTFTDNEYAYAINPTFDHSNIQSLLAQLVSEGFINYDFKNHRITLREKTAHYALAAQGKKDYDAINIQSSSTRASANMNVRTKETDIYEVKKIELSQRQKVGLLPSNNRLTLLKNRDMRLSGRLFAGFALFEGKDMAFNYDLYQIGFDSVRRLDFYLPEPGQFTASGQPVANAMNSSIEFVSGFLLVDAPNNKSGKDDLNIFPSLQSKKYSYVYYQSPETQRGVYTRDSFFFKLDPFAFNGLDSYTKEQLKFKGELFPATIFPPFREVIVVRPEDQSFGFVHRTPQTGYPTYSNKGSYTGALDLSNKGLRGKGKLEYLTAFLESEDLVFKPKQTTATARRFSMAEDRKSAVKVPQAKGENVSVNWLPFKDSMYVETKAKAFELFQSPGFTHTGLFILTPSGLKGKGEFEWAEGKLNSRLISYGPFHALADTANLQIKSVDGTGNALESKNVNAAIDFDLQTGRFKSNSQKTATTLPIDQYQTSMNEFTWDLREKLIDFKAEPGQPGFFISTDKNQDSLNFTGLTARYDMKTNLLKIGGVGVIKAADAFIYPEQEAVEVGAGGKINQLANARILADTINKYHHINRATVDILGKKLYRASGYYEYNIPAYNQEIFFNNIVGERRGGGSLNTKNVRTSASGDMAEKDSFRLDVTTRFKGSIMLEANDQNLGFEGFAKLDASGLPGNQWFSVHTRVDKNNPVVRIKNAKNESDDPLVTGFYLARETGDAYPRVLLPAYARVDRPLMDGQDLYVYDPKTDRFTFGDSAKIAANYRKGVKIVYDNRVSTIVGDGPIALGGGLAYMKVTGAGRLKSDYSTYTDSTGFQVTGEFMTGMEMNIPKPLLDLMMDEISAVTFDAPPAFYNNNIPFYTTAVHEFVTDDKEAPEAIANLRSNLILLPKTDNKYTFLLGRHPVIWNPEYQSFLSTEDKIPVVSINGQTISKTMTVFVEYKMPGSLDDRLYLYIRPSADLWYFFGYQSGALNVVSSSTRFNDLLLSMKPKDVQIKMPDGEIYEVVAANPGIADAFVNRVKNGRTRN
jgi:hypothetical protein